MASGKSEDEYVFKLADYVFSNAEHMYALSKSSTSLQQLMTPVYAAPELFSDTGCVVQPTKKSDIYSFGIVAHEVMFKKKLVQIFLFSSSLPLKLGIGHHYLVVAHNCYLSSLSRVGIMIALNVRGIEHLEEAMENLSPNEELEQRFMTSTDENSCAASSTIMLASIVESSECISGNTTTSTSEGTKSQNITAHNDEQASAIESHDNDNFIDDN